MTFRTSARIRFAHVDAAGIVFYPRYFELINAAVEDFLAETTGLDFSALHHERGLGVPVVKLEATFVSPGRLSECLDIDVTLRSLGRSSGELDFALSVGGQTRAQAKTVVVCTDLKSLRSTPWPEDIRHALEAHHAA